MSVLFLSNCTGRKTLPSAGSICANDLDNDSLREVCNSWKRLVRLEHPKIPANQLYCGRGFQDAKKSAKLLNAEHWIISAGLGLIKSDKKVPVYDLTLNGKGRSDIKAKIYPEEFNAATWWKELNLNKQCKSIADLAKKNPKSKIIIAVSTPYYTMISQDIAKLSRREPARIRLIGPSLNKYDPALLAGLLLPYDARLDGPGSPIPGTKSDFAQRAALHFATYVWPNSKNSTFINESKSIKKLLSNMGWPQKFQRLQKSDEEIEELILANWDNCKGYSSLMLRILRDELNIACEQTRFRNIFNQLKMQRDI